MSSQVALITGASAGVGRATALAFLEAGATVILTARRQEVLDSVVAESGAPRDRAVAITCDVTNETAVDALFSSISEHFGRLDVLFNNAGANIGATSFGDITYEGWKSIVDVNLNGMFLVAHRSFNMMRQQEPIGGRIINNGSISAHVPRPGSAPYTATKHAITGLTRSISLDGRDFNIACGQIDIGNAATEMTSKMVGGVPQADWTIKPEPTMDVANVANAVVHMASLPLDANVQFMTIMASSMPYIGRG